MEVNMLFFVFQNKNWIKARLNDLTNEGNPLNLPNVNELELSKIGELKRHLDDFSLEAIWEFCQNDFPTEYKETFIELYWKKSLRSVDVTDIIQVQNRLFQVESCGFSEIFKPPIVHVSQTINDKRLVPYFPTLPRNWFKDSVIERLILPQGCLETCQNNQDKTTYQRLR
jgi:hypothetical protein